METFNSNQGLCSIEVGPEGIAFACTPNPSNREITICGFQPYHFGKQLELGQFEQQLRQIVNQFNLKKAHCNWVLHPSYYHITLTDTPNVPQTEYKKAIRWQIKDIISHPLEDTAVDIFYPDEPEKNLKKVYVIVAQASFLQNLAQTIQDCGLHITAIDIREFAIRNLIVNLAKPNETIGSLNIVDTNCLMVSAKQSNIRFVRHFPVNALNLSNGNYHDLIAEIERSFNYCQAELKQETPSRFVMLPEAGFDKTIIENVAQNLNKEVTTLNLQEIVNFATPIDQQTEQRCWAAIGGALRNLTQE